MGTDYSLGERLRGIRFARQMTVAEVAERVGVSRPTIWSWESGKTRPREKRWQLLAQALNISEHELILGKEPDQRPLEITLEEQVSACKQHIAAAAGTEPDAVEITIRL